MSETKRRARYTLEFKLEAVRLVKGGQVPLGEFQNFLMIHRGGAGQRHEPTRVEKALSLLCRLRACDNFGDGQFTSASGSDNFALAEDRAKLNWHGDAKDVDAGRAAKEVLHGTPLYECAVAGAKNVDLFN